MFRRRIQSPGVFLCVHTYSATIQAQQLNEKGRVKCGSGTPPLRSSKVSAVFLQDRRPIFLHDQVECDCVPVPVIEYFSTWLESRHGSNVFSPFETTRINFATTPRRGRRTFWAIVFFIVFAVINAYRAVTTSRAHSRRMRS